MPAVSYPVSIPLWNGDYAENMPCWLNPSDTRQKTKIQLIIKIIKKTQPKKNATEKKKKALPWFEPASTVSTAQKLLHLTVRAILRKTP